MRPDAWVDFMMRFELQTGDARPQACLDQRTHDCGLLHRRWLNPAALLSAYCHNGTTDLDYRDPARFADFWLY